MLHEPLHGILCRQHRCQKRLHVWVALGKAPGTMAREASHAPELVREYFPGVFPTSWPVRLVEPNAVLSGPKLCDPRVVADEGPDDLNCPSYICRAQNRNLVADRDPRQSRIHQPSFRFISLLRCLFDEPSGLCTLHPQRRQVPLDNQQSTKTLVISGMEFIPKLIMEPCVKYGADQIIQAFPLNEDFVGRRTDDDIGHTQGLDCERKRVSLVLSKMLKKFPLPGIDADQDSGIFASRIPVIHLRQ
mmetsp:Transcript_85367/g.231297  ORF Transcript_85367/g.231297 Transcript_85367/m.231297 type:complete len:246 (-) Transcript_85367:203-940(-)